MLRKSLGIGVLIFALLAAPLGYADPKEAEIVGEETAAMAAGTAGSAAAYARGRAAAKKNDKDFIESNTAPFEKEIRAQQEIIRDYESHPSEEKRPAYEKAQKTYQDFLTKKQAITDLVRSPKKDPLSSGVFTAEETRAFRERSQELERINRAPKRIRSLGFWGLIGMGLTGLFSYRQSVSGYLLGHDDEQTIMLDDRSPEDTEKSPGDAPKAPLDSSKLYGQPYAGSASTGQ